METTDTVAYVLNYPNNGGFAIVSADNRINPVLAFSEYGNFSLALAPNNSGKNIAKRIVNGEGPQDYYPPFTYEQAVDSVAKLIYWIGKDVKMKYTPVGSGASSDNALSLLRKENFEISSGGWIYYTPEKAARYIGDNCILYMRGADYSNPKKPSGHALVADGGYYCIDNKSQNIIDAYIHCDWGWNGLCNGFFQNLYLVLQNTLLRV